MVVGVTDRQHRRSDQHVLADNARCRNLATPVAGFALGCALHANEFPAVAVVRCVRHVDHEHVRSFELYRGEDESGEFVQHLASLPADESVDRALGGTGVVCDSSLN